MNKKHMIWIGAGVAIILLAGMLLVLISRPKSVIYFTKEPETWVMEDRITGNTKIDLKKATAGLVRIDGNKEEMYVEGRRVTFFFGGYLEGSSFDDVFIDSESYINDHGLALPESYEDIKPYVRMRFTNQIDPADDVPEVFILAKEEERMPVFYLFFDDAFLETLDFANVMYGNTFDNMKERKINTSTKEQGIYIDKISGLDWDIAKGQGGIYAGEISKRMIGEKVTTTFVYLR